MAQLLKAINFVKVSDKAFIIRTIMDTIITENRRGINLHSHSEDLNSSMAVSIHAYYVCILTASVEFTSKLLKLQLTFLGAPKKSYLSLIYK